MKKTFYSEAAYSCGLAALALGTALMEAADFGVSMVVAPAYLLYLRLSLLIPGFTFGMAEYTLQAVLLLCMMLLLRRFRLSYLFSFVTALLYGALLDGAMALVGLIDAGSIAVRCAFYTGGLLLCAIGVSLLFRTYISPEVYELFVKEVSARYGVEIHRFKTGYDCVSCLVGVVLSFVFFGFGTFRGVKWGTVLCALVNGFLISRCSAFWDRHCLFRDGLPLRCYFVPAAVSEAHAPQP